MERRRGLSWYYEDGMLIMTAAVPVERGAPGNLMTTLGSVHVPHDAGIVGPELHQ